MEEEIELELSEKNGIGHIKIDGKEIKQITKYIINRNAETDTVEVTITISVSSKKFKTI